jgi:hypothetical protein
VGEKWIGLNRGTAPDLWALNGRGGGRHQSEQGSEVATGVVGGSVRR